MLDSLFEVSLPENSNLDQQWNALEDYNVHLLVSEYCDFLVSDFCLSIILCRY